MEYEHLAGKKKLTQFDVNISIVHSYFFFTL